MRRPGRAKMNSWLALRLAGIRVTPSNPFDLAALAANAKLADQKLERLRGIASDLGWHADADLDVAWEEILAYDQRFHPAAPELVQPSETNELEPA